MSETIKEEKTESTKPTKIKRLAVLLYHAIIDKVRGKDVRKQLDFLLNPATIETSSRLKRNEVMAINNADFLGRHFDRFEPLRNFWVGVSRDKELFVKGRGGGFARWVCSIEGKRIQEAISFMGAVKEQKILAPIISALEGKKEAS